MFTLKKTQKKGVCAAMRCKASAADLLCPKHELEWKAAGCPLLSAEPAAAVGGLTRPDLKIRLDQEREKAARALAMIQHLPSDTPAALEKLGALVNTAGAMINKLEEERKREVQPRNDAVKEINSWFKPVTDFYRSAQKALKDKIADAISRQEQARNNALAEIALDVDSARPEAFALAHAPLAEPSSVQVRERVTYAVQDADKVPEEYWTRVLNYKLIEADVKAGKEIPGVMRIVEKQVVAGRTS